MCLLVCSKGEGRETGRKEGWEGAGHGKEDSKKNYLRARKSPDNPGNKFLRTQVRLESCKLYKIQEVRAGRTP